MFCLPFQEALINVSRGNPCLSFLLFNCLSLQIELGNFIFTMSNNMIINSSRRRYVFKVKPGF